MYMYDRHLLFSAYKRNLITRLKSLNYSILRNQTVGTASSRTLAVCPRPHSYSACIPALVHPTDISRWPYLNFPVHAQPVERREKKARTTGLPLVPCCRPGFHCLSREKLLDSYLVIGLTSPLETRVIRVEAEEDCDSIKTLFQDRDISTTIERKIYDCCVSRWRRRRSTEP